MNAIVFKFGTAALVAAVAFGAGAFVGALLDAAQRCY